MDLKLVVAISALAAMPTLAQSQQSPPASNAPKPTTEEIQKVVQIITSDKTKTKQYCDLGQLNQQLVKAEEKKDNKTIEALGKRADDLAEKIGPEYVKLMDALDQIDQDSNESKEIVAALDSLDKLCAKK
jgi:archaellum component FlaC